MTSASRFLVWITVPLLGASSALLLPACGDDASGEGDDDGTTSTSGQGGNGTTTTQSSTTASSSSPSSTSTESTTSTSTSTSTSGAGGCYATFDGVDDGLFATVGAEVGLTDGFSLGAFVNPEPLPVDGVAFVAGRHADGSSNGYYLAITNAGGTYRARLNVFINGTCSVEADIPGPGTWQHILGSFTTNEMHMFVNGQLAASADCGSPCIIDPSSVVTVGRSVVGYYPYAGSIDDVAYYAQPFSSAFDPATLGCGSNAALRYSFDAVTPGRASTVAEDCQTSADAQVGDAAGADGSDPTFSCP